MVDILGILLKSQKNHRLEVNIMSQNKRFALKLRAEDGTKGPKPQGVCLRGQRQGSTGADMGVGSAWGAGYRVAGLPVCLPDGPHEDLSVVT